MLFGIISKVGGTAGVILNVAVAVHPLTSVTVAVYDPVCIRLLKDPLLLVPKRDPSGFLRSKELLPHPPAAVNTTLPDDVQVGSASTALRLKAALGSSTVTVSVAVQLVISSVTVIV